MQLSLEVVCLQVDYICLLVLFGFEAHENRTAFY